MISIQLDHESVYPSPEDQTRRLDQLSAGIDFQALELIGRTLDLFVVGKTSMQALDLNYQLEKATPMIHFHAMLRNGERNRLHTGLQQSYGEHIRMVSHGIDRLSRGDLDWYLGRFPRLWSTVEFDLKLFFEKYHCSVQSKELCASVWIAACLHDYGMLFHRRHGIDAENAVVLAKPILDSLCSDRYRSVVDFGIRNHDLVENIQTGEVPIRFIERQLPKSIPMRRAALALVGAIQFSGAASLGEGRLTKEKVRLCLELIDDDIHISIGPDNRFAQLLGANKSHHPAEIDQILEATYQNLDEPDRAKLDKFIESVVLYGWQDIDFDGVCARHSLLMKLFHLWNELEISCDHLLLESLRCFKSDGNDASELYAAPFRLLNNSFAAEVVCV